MCGQQQSLKTLMNMRKERAQAVTALHLGAEELVSETPSPVLEAGFFVGKAPDLVACARHDWPVTSATRQPKGASQLVEASACRCTGRPSTSHSKAMDHDKKILKGGKP